MDYRYETHSCSSTEIEHSYLLETERLNVIAERTVIDNRIQPSCQKCGNWNLKKWFMQDQRANQNNNKHGFNIRLFPLPCCSLVRVWVEVFMMAASRKNMTGGMFSLPKCQWQKEIRTCFPLRWNRLPEGSRKVPRWLFSPASNYVPLHKWSPQPFPPRLSSLAKWLKTFLFYVSEGHSLYSGYLINSIGNSQTTSPVKIKHANLKYTGYDSERVYFDVLIHDI